MTKKKEQEQQEEETVIEQEQQQEESNAQEESSVTINDMKGWVDALRKGEYVETEHLQMTLNFLSNCQSYFSALGKDFKIARNEVKNLQNMAQSILEGRQED